MNEKNVHKQEVRPSVTPAVTEMFDGIELLVIWPSICSFSVSVAAISKWISVCLEFLLFWVVNTASLNSTNCCTVTWTSYFPASSKGD